MEKSKSFIRTKSNSWDIDDDVPIVNNNIPVISAIGTSRDGKSTSLNLYANWLIDNDKNTQKSWYKWLFTSSSENKPFSPFVAMQTDDVVTNGIDYYIVPDKCMLVDCQGMQLKDARYDHFLMLITYLISNVIILTVRERLDLQVLNNCLAVFSFLSEIPSEFKRKDKPILLIRIKDFQNTKQLNADPEYLHKLVDKWLEKSNDQYDQIKEAFRNTFDIEVIATKYPTMNDDDEVNIHDDDFLNKNPTFLNYCKKLDELSKNKNAPSILHNSDNLIKLIKSLQQNANIDWKKLDLYHQITENELRKYLQEHVISNKVFSDETLIAKMDGSNKSRNLYLERFELLKHAKEQIFNDRFKDVTISIKEEVFNAIFDKFQKIASDAQEKNMIIAETIIKPHFEKYTNQFKETNFAQYCINKISNYFNNKKKDFIPELAKIDLNVGMKYMEIINQETIMIIEKEKIININNEKQKEKINNLIIRYDINKHMKKYIKDELEILLNSLNYNVSYENVFQNNKQKIILDITQIYNDNDLTWFLDSNKNIESSKNKTIYKPEEDFNNILKVSDINQYYWNLKEKILTDMGIIKYSQNKLDYNVNNKINFVVISCNSFKFLVTSTFYKLKIMNKKENIIEQFLNNKLKIKVNKSIEEKQNVIFETYCLDKIFNGSGEPYPIFINLLKLAFGKFLMKFCTENNIEFYNDIRY